MVVGCRSVGVESLDDIDAAPARDVHLVDVGRTGIAESRSVNDQEAARKTHPENPVLTEFLIVGPRLSIGASVIDDQQA